MKKLFVKLPVFLFILFILQKSSGTLYNYIDYPEIAVLDYNIVNPIDIIYFGDSTVTHYNKQDENQKTTSEMLEDELPNYSIRPFVHAAYHMEIYLELCKYILKKECQIKFVIIPINLRSFSKWWDLNPRYQFVKEKTILRYTYLARPLLAFKTFDIKPIKSDEYIKGLNLDSSSEENIKDMIRSFYMYPLTKEHRKIKAMVEIAKVMRESDIKLIFYITPIDYQTGRQYFGKQFAEKTNKNINLIKSLLKDKGVKPLDLSFELSRPSFNWEEERYVNEHLKEDGRGFVAKQLYQAIKTQYIEK